MAQHTAHHQGAGIEICYPYHSLYRQTVIVLREERTHGETHLRVVT